MLLHQTTEDPGGGDHLPQPNRRNDWTGSDTFPKPSACDPLLLNDLAYHHQRSLRQNLLGDQLYTQQTKRYKLGATQRAARRRRSLLIFREEDRPLAIGTVTYTAWPPLNAVKYSFHSQKIVVLWLAPPKGSAVFPFPLWRVYGRSGRTVRLEDGAWGTSAPAGS